MFEELQRTQEWHQKRVGRVTGSVAGAILGLSPFMKPQDVLRSMVRAYHGAPSEFVDNPAVQHGNMHERAAMLCFMRETGMHVEDCGFMTKGDWLGASPDGLTDDGGVLEIKAPYSLRNGGEFKPLSAQPHYELQVQMELLCSGASHAYFAQYRAPKGDPFSPDYISEAIHIERVEPRNIDAEMASLREFYELYLSELDNPAHLDPLRVVIDTDEAKRIVNRIGEIDDALHNLTAEKKSHMDKLVEIADGKNADIAGRKLTSVTRKTISYAKAIKDIAPDADLEQYTTSSSSWRLS